MFENLSVFAALGGVSLAMVSTELWRLWSERMIVRVSSGDERLLAAITLHEQYANHVRSAKAFAD